MSAQEPVIALSNETSESERVDSSAIPSTEHPAAKDVSPAVDPSPAKPVTELPAEAARTTSDDTPFIMPTHDTNIPNTVSTNFNGSLNEVEATPFVSVELLCRFFCISAPGLGVIHLRSFGTAFT